MNLRVYILQEFDAGEVVASRIAKRLQKRGIQCSRQTAHAIVKKHRPSYDPMAYRRLPADPTRGTKRIQVEISESLSDKLSRAAAQRGVPIGTCVRHLIAEAFGMDGQP